jgi:hypothetical protein
MGSTDTQHIEQFIRLFFAGLGLLLIGGVNLLLGGARAWVRGVATLSVVGAVLAGYAAWESNPALVGRVASFIAVGLVPVALLGSRRLVDFAVAVVRVAQKPKVRWGLLAFVGLGVVAVGGIRFSIKDEIAVGKEMSELELMSSTPELEVIERVPAKTDRGSVLVMRRPQVLRNRAEIDTPEDKAMRGTGYDQFVIRREPATDYTNCHGWVFTGGQYWVDGASVQKILDDNGYEETKTPRPGDLVIYRNVTGVSHTGVVRYLAEGQPVMIESKWAWMGVFLHPVDKSAYGHDYKYYRASRPTHVLAGLERPERAGGAQAVE